MKLKPLGALAAVVLFLGLGLWFADTVPGWRLNGIFLDFAARQMGEPRPAPDHAVIFITEKDYDQKATPFALWGKHLTPLLARLSRDQPKAVGLDLILPRFSLAWLNKEIDRGFFRELTKLKKIARLVSGYSINAQGKIREPFVFYQRILGPEGYGYFNLTPDPDKVNRSLSLVKYGTKKEKLYAFAALLADGPPRVESVTPDWRSPARFASYSYADAISAPPGSFSQKTVLIGMKLDFQDRHLTPAAPEPRPGVIFQARVAEALASGKTLYDPGWLLSSLGPALFAFILLAFCLRLASVSRTIVSGAAVLAATGILCAACLCFGLILRPAAAVAAVLAATAVLVVWGDLKVKESFGHYVSKRVRDEILAGRIPLDGQLKMVTVMFADLRDFTPFTASHPPKRVLAMINRYFHQMSQAINDQGGLVLQYIGDEVFAVFGAPLASETQTLDAIRAAFEMCRRLEELNRDLEREGLPKLSHGIGIHYGQAVAGNLGGAGRLNYTLIGDTVNLASRIQGFSKECGAQILVSSIVRQRLGERYPLQELPPVSLKGVKDPVILFKAL